MTISVNVVALGSGPGVLACDERQIYEVLRGVSALSLEAGILLSVSETAKSGEAVGPAYRVYCASGRYGGSFAELRWQLAGLSGAGGIGFTFCAVPVELASREKKLVVLDVDSTLICQEVIDEIAARSGCGSEVASVTERAMAGDLDFEQSLRARVALLRGVPVDVLDEVAGSVLLSPGATELVRLLTAQGHRVCAVSGGFIQVLGPLAQRLGLDDVRANRLEIVSGVLTGEVTGQVVTPEFKRQSLKEWAAAEGVSPRQVIAVGDGANDLLMLDQAALGIAFMAKPRLREVADVRIDIPRLDAVRHFIGV